MNVPRRNRLTTFDYTQPGAYFVTLCAFEKEHLFGTVLQGEMQASRLGELVEMCWKETPERFSHVELDDFVLMPNHFHGIIVLGNGPSKPEGTSGVSPGSLSAVVRSFKGASTKLIRAVRPERTAPVWQRNYYDHIVRNEVDLDRIRTYMRNNPANWALDRFARD